MNNFFATPTDIWDDDAVMLTPVGIGIMIAVIALLILTALAVTGRRQKKEETKPARFAVRQLVCSAMAIALATVTSMIKLADMPLGGSVTLLSMLFIALVGYWYGPTAGITAGMAYGLLQFVLEPVFYTLPQMFVDYPLAFGALGLSGLFRNRKFGLQIGYTAGVLGRFAFSFLSGVLFFAAYAPENMHPAVYSAVYNGSYLAAEGVLTLIIISIPPVAKALKYVKNLIAAK